MGMESTELDSHGQPQNSRFNHNRNKAKSAYTLRGILQGITADNKLNENELLFLDMWLQSQGKFKTGDILDLLHIITEVIEDEIISNEELAEIHELIDDIIEYGTQSSSEVENTVNELLGLLQGISADEKITEEEFNHLDNWINKNQHIEDEWITEELVKKINTIKEDGVITREELDSFLLIVKSLSGHTFSETGMADSGVSEVFSADIECFTHNGKTICFTGEFLNGTRRIVEDTAKEYGAMTKKDVTQQVDALIIGTFTSKDWRFSSYGRKIEKAWKQQKKGHHIIILSERQWIKSLKSDCK